MKSNAWQNLGLAGLFAGTLAIVVYLFTGWPPEPPRSNVSPAAVQRATQPSPSAIPVTDQVVFVGDSYTDAQGAADPSGGYASLTADALGLDATILAERGGGFITEGEFGETVPSLIQGRIVDPSVETVVIASGFNDYDRGYPMARIRSAAANTFTLAERHWPKAEIVVLGPWAVTVPPPDGRIDLRDALAAEARQAGLPFVDTHGWTADVELGEDGIHPTAAGHVSLAEHVTKTLQAQGIR